MGGRHVGRIDSIRRHLAAAGGVVALLTPLVTHAATGTFNVITGQFFPRALDSGQFAATPAMPAAFGQAFPTINFNAAADTVPCSNATGVDDTTRPFTDVVPQSDGSCATLVAGVSGERAGTNDLFAFDAVFRGTLTIGAGDVTFHLSSDDGWILGIGPGPGGAQPAYVSGTNDNAPGTTPFAGYQTVGAYNQNSSPAQHDLVVHFPTAGTYPFELDYTECCGGELLLAMTADGGLLPANVAPDCSTAVASIATLWPPNQGFVDVSVTGVRDLNGDPISITLTSITQDEPLNGKGEGNVCPDARGVGTATASLRAEREDGGHGRTYHIDFMADDGRGGQCAGEVTACVPQAENQACVDQAAQVDSTGPTCVAACASGCAIEALLAQPPCAGENVPAALIHRLDEARRFVARAAGAPNRGRARKLMRRAMKLAKQAAKFAARSAEGGALSAGCATSVATEISGAKTSADRWLATR
jgi:hypothetical protein